MHPEKVGYNIDSRMLSIVFDVDFRHLVFLSLQILLVCLVNFFLVYN